MLIKYHEEFEESKLQIIHALFTPCWRFNEVKRPRVDRPLRIERQLRTPIHTHTYVCVMFAHALLRLWSS